MKIPKNILLRLVKQGVESGEIAAEEVRAILPTDKVSKTVPKDILRAVREQGARLGLANDGLRLSARPRERTGNFALYLLDAKTCKSVAAGIGVEFVGLADLPAAADRVIENYLGQLAAE